MPFCPSCGKSVPENIAFCPYCGRNLSAPAMQAQPRQPVATTQSSNLRPSTSHAGRNAVIVIILLLLFFLAPVVPYTFASYSFLGANVQASAYVSPSFAVFHCGLVVNPQVSGSGYGIAGSYSTAQWAFTCNANG